MATTERPPKRVRTEAAEPARDAAVKAAPVRTPVKRVFKVALDSPFTVRWPTVEAATQERVVELLRSEFGDVGEQRLARQREISRAWLVAKRKNKGDTEAGEAVERPKQIPLPDGVVTGFNSASRLCEQGKARMLVRHCHAP